MTSCTIVQLTDCHLLSDPQGVMNGVVTRPRLDVALEDVRRRVPDFDLLVVTGDTASDESLAAYEAFRDALGDWAARLLIVPGNHDDRSLLLRLFPESCSDTGGRVTFRVTMSGWQVVGLDSQVSGEAAGELGGEQLAWFRGFLDAEPGLDAVLFLHHPPIEMGSPWLDEIGLRDADALATLLDEHPRVRLAVSGHVHQESSGTVGATTVHTTPAVGPQFAPRTTVFELEPGPPGYRIIELGSDRTWSTSVVRCG